MAMKLCAVRCQEIFFIIIIFVSGLATADGDVRWCTDVSSIMEQQKSLNFSHSSLRKLNCPALFERDATRKRQRRKEPHPSSIIDHNMIDIFFDIRINVFRWQSMWHHSLHLIHEDVDTLRSDCFEWVVGVFLRQAPSRRSGIARQQQLLL